MIDGELQTIASHVVAMRFQMQQQRMMLLPPNAAAAASLPFKNATGTWTDKGNFL
jgi:hypothetical protein